MHGRRSHPLLLKTRCCVNSFVSRDLPKIAYARYAGFCSNRAFRALYRNIEFLQEEMDRANSGVRACRLNITYNKYAGYFADTLFLALHLNIAFSINKNRANSCVKQFCTFGHVRTSTLDRPFKITFLALHLNIAFSVQKKSVGWEIALLCALFIATSSF